MRHIEIPLPLAPEDAHLPVSRIEFLGESGIIFINIPIQGKATIRKAIATLELWKDTLVVREDFSI